MRYFSRLPFAQSLLLAGGLLAGGRGPVFAAPPSGAPPAPAPPALRAPIRAVLMASGDAYLPGAAQMVAPAQAATVLLHPQGRYALIIQNEAAPPPGEVTGKSTTGAAALLLYDARLNKTRTLWESRADTGSAVERRTVAWLPGSDCAVAVIIAGIRGFDPRTETEPIYTYSLLFFNFAKSLSAKTLLTSQNALLLTMSPNKPVYLIAEINQIRVGGVRGTLGPLLPTSDSTYWIDWNKDGTAVYGMEFYVEPPTAPDTKAKKRQRWLAWDGQSAAPILLPARPAAAQMAQKNAPPVLPFSAQTVALPVPPRSKSESPAVLHPLYLDAGDTAADAPNHSALIAPDADESYLLPDKSAVLYTTGGALYAVPLTHLSQTAFADARKAALRQAAMSTAKQVGLGILGYIQDYDEKFPPQAGFRDLLSPYLKDPGLLSGFTYVYPGVNQASMENVAAVVMGYVSGAGGRAVLYADGHVRWQEAQ